MTPLRVQKTAQMPSVKFTEKLVEVTMIMRTRSGSASTVPAVRRSGGYSNGDVSDTGRCQATGRNQEAAETTQVQFKEINQQVTNGCRTSTRSRRLLRSHKLCDRDRCRTRTLTRYRRRSSCRGEQCPTSRRSRLGSSAVQNENQVEDMPVVKGRRARFRRAGCSNVVAGCGSGG